MSLGERLVRSAFHRLRVAVGAAPPPVPQRMTLAGVLAQILSAGFRPAVVLDVGAAFGSFTRECAQMFPAARYILVEPLDEFRATLDALVASLHDATVVAAAASDRCGEHEINVHADLVGSSLLCENEGPHVDGESRRVSVTTLDDLLERHALRPPMFLKLDVQGAELEVLRGARNTLAGCEVVLAEASLFRFFDGGPIISDLIAEMAAVGFVLYDIAGLLYRPLDGALAQVDLVFVREAGPFRRHHHFADRNQRQKQDRHFREFLRRALATDTGGRVPP